MRLICPNCDAQYEVDDGAIPDAGRDVQCSNCGHAWFQMPPDLEAEMEAEEALFGRAPGIQVPQPVSTQSIAAARTSDQGDSKTWEDDTAADKPEAKPAVTPGSPDAKVEDRDQGEGRDEDEDDADDDAAASQPAAALAADLTKTTTPPTSAEQMPQPLAPRRGLDESLLAVLREEAEREAAVRRSETPRPLESQTELGLEETSGAASAAKAVRDRLARLRGQEAEPETTEKPTARRDLLPDIEEINSTLRASTENRSGDEAVMAQPEAAAAPPSTGFRSGFSLMLLLGVILIATYVAAPKIAAQFPAAKGAMESYVAGVDAVRIWLDSAMRNAISSLQNLTGADNN